MLVVTTAVVAAAATLLITVLPFVSFAYRSHETHIVIETAAALISTLVAVLVYGRFRRTGRTSDLVLFAAMLLFAGTNLFFSVIPPTAHVDDTSGFTTWAPVIGRFLSAVVFAWAAFASDRPVRWRFDPPLLVGSVVLALLALVAATAGVVGDLLPDAIDRTLSHESASRTRIVGSPLVLAQQVASMVLFGAAALGFLRRAERTGEAFSSWLAVAAVLGAFARLNYFLFPSLYSEFVYTGDVLRLGFFVLLLVAASREIGRAQRGEAEAAVLDTRRRIARDIHDGLAQELAFIVSHSRRLGERAVGRREEQALVLRQLADAAQRALDESRAAIEVLTTPMDEPLDVALCRSAETVAERLGARVRLDLTEGLAVPREHREALVRIVREATTNAVRHGEARTVRLELDGPSPLRVKVVDDGSGFDVASVDGGGFGLTSMRERAEALGGSLRVDSTPGEGTTVEVMLP